MDSLANIQPSNLALSKNPIVVNVEPVSPVLYPQRAGLRYLLDVFTPKFFQASEYALLTTLEASEEPPQRVADVYIYAGAYFDLSELLHSQLESKPPSYGQAGFMVCETLTTSYYTKLRILEGDVLIDEQLNPTLTVYRGGIGTADYEAFQQIFFTRFTGGRRFLTYKPNACNIRPDQPEYLTFLTNFAPLPTELRVRMYVKYDDNSREYLTGPVHSGITAKTAYCLPVGMEPLGLLDLPKAVIEYDVWVANEQNERLSELRTYLVDDSYVRQVRYILFENSLGAYDTLAVTGNGTESLKVVRQLANRFTGFDYLPSSREQVINRVSGERQLSVAFGYPRYQAKQLREWWQELFFSEQFYLVTDRALISLTPVTDSYLAADDNEDLVARSMSFRYTNEERSFGKLPNLPPVAPRPTGWRGDAPACENSPSTGLRTSWKRYGLLVKYYLDNGEDVKPYTQKPNSPGTEGYIPPWLSEDCNPDKTPYVNAAVSAPSTLIKAGCAAGKIGTRWVISVPAGTYGSENSQNDANTKALTALALLDTQANANLYGSCVVASPIPLGVRNDCPGDANGYTGSAYNPVVAVINNGVEVISNTAFGPAIRYADVPLQPGSYTLDVRANFTAPPTLPYRIRIPSKNLASPVLTSNNTYRFANVAVAWGDAELIIIIEPA